MWCFLGILAVAVSIGIGLYKAHGLGVTLGYAAGVLVVGALVGWKLMR